ncbi:MAG: hypothetical protein RBT73_05115 [Spirochaetia bacterium]|nr:hypothetical protein [Spirochaetia bacterium]
MERTPQRARDKGGDDVPVPSEGKPRGLRARLRGDGRLVENPEGDLALCVRVEGAELGFDHVEGEGDESENAVGRVIRLGSSFEVR